MIALFMLLAAQAVAPAQPSTNAGPLAAIGKQALPKRGCAAYLWTIDNRQFVAMATAEPALLRLAVDGKVGDLALVSQSGSIGFGFGGVTQYRRDDVTATLDMAIATRADITAGATVSTASMRIDRPGHDTIVVPVGGLIGCV